MDQQSDDSDWEFDDTNENDELFNKAAQQVQRTHDKLVPNDLLELYGLYKQGTVGKCNASKPNLFNMQARAKWCAWNDLNDMPCEKAKVLYIEKVKTLDSEWWENIQKGVKMPEGVGGTGWVVHSIELPPEDLEHKEEHEKTLFDFVKENNSAKVRDLLRPTHLQELDCNGLALIHWAADCNNLEILEFLLTSGCPVDLRDTSQLTALHYATSCGHLECVKLLLNYGADRMAKDENGESCIEVAEDPAVKSLLLQT